MPNGGFMGKIVLNTDKLTPKQAKLISYRKQTIDNIFKDCKKLGYSEQELKSWEHDFL